MKKVSLLILSAMVLSSCNWALKMSNAEQTFESTIMVVPVKEIKNL